MPISITPIHTVQPAVPLTTALSMLLEAGISALPVVDENGVLLDVYARGDITLLVRSHAYSRLQFEDMTVGQALSLVSGGSQQAAPSRSSNGSGAHQLFSLFPFTGDSWLPYVLFRMLVILCGVACDEAFSVAARLNTEAPPCRVICKSSGQAHAAVRVHTARSAAAGAGAFEHASSAARCGGAS